MAQFPVNPYRHDPYKSFKFRVKWDGRYVAGVSYLSSLHRTTAVVNYREGGDPSRVRKSPGQTGFDPLVLRRGVTHDAEFEDWADLVWRLGATAGHEVSLKDFRRDVIVELLNEAGQVVKAYRVYRCWPSQYRALSDLDAAGDEVVYEELVLEHEGWERDPEVTEPVEPGG